MERSINNLKIHQITVSLILLNYKLFFMNLQITSEDGTQDVGKISKQWSGLMREYFTDADNFGVSCKYMLINMINYWIVGIFSIQKKKIELRLPVTIWWVLSKSFTSFSTSYIKVSEFTSYFWEIEK